VINPLEQQKVALITGAAGGLGRGLVAEFCAQNWRIAAGYHREHQFQETENLWALPLDVTNRAHATEAVEKIIRRWGRLDVLVNNAGITCDRALMQMSEADWERVMEVNLTGAFRCAQAALKPMLKQRAGQIINITSFAARQGPRGQANYAAAKAGIIGFTESLAREVGPRNIRVNAVLPGVLPTPMTAKLTPAQLAEFAQANVLGRLNSIAEVARFIVFLATTQNISGQIFPLDSRIAKWS
jgi:3-oxoacyl-[acyl-carrier protein] reductase